MYRAAIYFDIRPTHWAEVDTTRPQVCQQRPSCARSAAGRRESARAFAESFPGLHVALHCWPAIVIRPFGTYPHLSVTLQDGMGCPRHQGILTGQLAGLATFCTCNHWVRAKNTPFRGSLVPLCASVLSEDTHSINISAKHQLTKQSEVQPPRRPRTSLRSIKLCT